MGKACSKASKSDAKQVKSDAKQAIGYTTFQNPQNIVEITRLSYGDTAKQQQPLMLAKDNGTLFGFLEANTRGADQLVSYLEQLVVAHASLAFDLDRAGGDVLISGVEGARKVWFEDYDKLIKNEAYGGANVQGTFVTIEKNHLFVFRGHSKVFIRTVVYDTNGMFSLGSVESNLDSERFCAFCGQMKDAFLVGDVFKHLIKVTDAFLIVCSDEPEEKKIYEVHEVLRNKFSTAQAAKAKFDPAELVSLLQNSNSDMKIIVVPLNAQ